MSEFEATVDPLIQRLVDGEMIGSFSQEEIAQLARWSGKTAVVLSHVTPQCERVPKRASVSLHPHSGPPKLFLFYDKLYAAMTLEGGFLQLVYGSELLVGTDELSGTRITLCVYNHCFTVDFPPIVEGVRYDLRESSSIMLWPSTLSAGLTEIDIPASAQIGDVFYAICSRVKVGFNFGALSS